MVISSALVFGRVLACLRRDANMTQKQLAEHGGLRQSAVTHLETGRTTPTFYLLMSVGTLFADQGAIEGPWTFFELVKRVSNELVGRGFEVVHRPLEKGGALSRSDLAMLDRVVGITYDRWLAERDRHANIIGERDT